MNSQQEKWGWAILCEETGEKLFPFGSEPCYPGQQPLVRREFDPTPIPCSVGFRHEHVVTTNNVRWMRDDR